MSRSRNVRDSSNSVGPLVKGSYSSLSEEEKEEAMTLKEKAAPTVCHMENIPFYIEPKEEEGKRRIAGKPATRSNVGIKSTRKRSRKVEAK
mgnify:CR=1 FL=1